MMLSQVKQLRSESEHHRVKSEIELTNTKELKNYCVVGFD